MEQWAYININGGRIAGARAHATDLNQANVEIKKANAIIQDIYKDLNGTQTDLGVKTAEAQALRMVLRSLIADGSLDQEKANQKYKKAIDVAKAELKKKGAKKYTQSPSEFEV